MTNSTKLQSILGTIEKQNPSYGLEHIGEFIEIVADEEQNIHQISMQLSRISSAIVKRHNMKGRLLDHDKLLSKIKEIAAELKIIDESDIIDLKNELSLSSKNIKAKKDFVKQIKLFAIYELYKVINPHKIAGETAELNFIHNLKEYGVNTALKYEKPENDIKNNQLIKKTTGKGSYLPGK